MNQFYLSGLVSVRYSDAVRCVWDVVVRLVFVDVLQESSGNNSHPSGHNRSSEHTYNTIDTILTKIYDYGSSLVYKVSFSLNFIQPNLISFHFIQPKLDCVLYKYTTMFHHTFYSAKSYFNLFHSGLRSV